MVNRTQGAGNSAPVFQSDVQGRQQPSAPPGPQVPPQQPLQRATAPRAPASHPLQRQARAESARPESPLTQSVDSNTTILDMVKWNTRDNIVQAGNFLVIGHEERIDEPRLHNVVVAPNPKIKLELYTGQTMSARDADHAVAQGKQAVFNMLANTIRAYRLQGTPAEQMIRMQCKHIGHPRFRMTVAALGELTRLVGEVVHAQKTREIGPSRAPRAEAGRMPMECMTHLGHALRSAPANLDPDLDQNPDPAQLQLLHEIGLEVKRRVMQHQLTFGDTKDFLRQVEGDCQRAGLPKMEKLVADLRAAIPDPSPQLNYQTRLHDNIYGRAMESAMIAELVSNPPDSVKRSMSALAEHLDRTLLTLSPQGQLDVAYEVQDRARDERRGWQTKSPELETFFNAPPQRVLGALQNLLRAPKENGFDCIAVPYLTVKISVALRYQGAAPWMKAADDNYTNVIGPASSRLAEKAPNKNRESRKSGITLHHQPDMVSSDSTELAMHPADRYRPNLDPKRVSVEVRQALEHGVPFAGGVSGSTNIVMYMVHDIRAKHEPIDAKDAMLGTMMFLNYDGGHSMHEAMWVGNQLDHTLNLGMGMPGGTPSSFIANYDDFIASFPAEQGGSILRAAADTAWDATLNYFGNNSHYSPQNKLPETSPT